jgi:hypothetical protein
MDAPSHEQEQLQEQTFDMRTNAGKANTSLRQASITRLRYVWCSRWGVGGMSTEGCSL